MIKFLLMPNVKIQMSIQCQMTKNQINYFAIWILSRVLGIDLTFVIWALELKFIFQF